MKTDPTKFPSLLSSLFKSATVGRVLASKLLRFIFSLPGVAIDQLLGVLFPSYLNLHDNFNHDFDYNRVHPFTGFFGNIGDIIGRVLGWPIGLLIGLVLFVPDAIMITVVNGYRAFGRGIPLLAKEFGNYTSHSVCWHAKPDNWFGYFANIGSVFIGIPLVFAPFLVFRAIEFFIPGLKNIPSTIFLACGASVGAIIGYAASLVAIPVGYLLGRLTEAYDAFREALRDGVAVVYAKNNMTVLAHDRTNKVVGREEDYYMDKPMFRDYSDEFIRENIHSDAFRQKVDTLRDTSWSKLIFGVFASELTQDIVAPLEVPSAPPLFVENEEKDPVMTTAELVATTVL